ncbi:hypothetical protein M758_1G059100 [Ceratodon purpureus]|nr:hypothetical protein M758_1G059100 [Ceratodon purpureus]
MKRERCDDEKPEVGKRGRVDHEDAEVHVGPSQVRGEQIPVVQVKEEGDSGEELFQKQNSDGAQLQLGGGQDDEGNDSTSEPETDSAASDENSSKVDEEESGDVEEEYEDDYEDDFFRFQEDFFSEYMFSNSAYPHVGPRGFIESAQIADLHPSLVGKWETQGRVVYKFPVRSYDNHNGKGKYFSFEMADEHGGEIRVVCFNKLVDEFFNKVIKDKWIVLRNGRLQTPSPRFNFEQRKCEVVLQYNSTIREIPDVVKVEELETLVARDDPEKELLRKQVIELQRQVQDYKVKLELLESQGYGEIS